jgi:photosystem II stability/assembly factor-like uncharacterized protein
MRTITKFIPVIAAVLLIGQGCPIKFSGGGGNDGGIFRSADRGANWVQKGAVLSIAGGRTMAGTNVLTVVADPQNPSTIYIGTAENGLFYSIDGGETWAQPGAIAGARIPSIAPDPKNTCTLYAVTANQVIKTTDCARSWGETFRDSRADVVLTSIAIDHFNASVIYVTTSRGDLLKSSDAGSSWIPANVFPSAAQKVIVDPFDSRALYVGTKSSGVWKSTDGGSKWVDVSADLAQFDGAKDFYDLVPDRARKDGLMIVSRFGLVRTVDAAAHWEKVALLTPPGQARIYSFASNPQNGLEMYYATATIFYASVNGGVNWTTKRLPTSRAGSAMLVNAKDPAIIYLGTLLLKK